MSLETRKLEVDGILLVDKPKGLTSFDVVGQLRRLYRTRRIGHTGTLDPMATGLMVVLLGRATRLAPFITDTEKGYDALVTFGIATNTYDAEGDVLARTADVSCVTEASIRSSLKSFCGEIQQRPPIYSAIKIKGERAYARARRGEEFEVDARQVTVHEFSLLRYMPPEAEFTVRCSKGTYIRSLAHDLGQMLSVGAHLSGLRRTMVGQFLVKDAVSLDRIESMDWDERQSRLDSLASAVSHLPTLHLDENEVTAIRHGKTIFREGLVNHLHRAVDSSGCLVAIVDVNDEGQVSVRRGIPPATT